MVKRHPPKQNLNRYQSDSEQSNEAQSHEQQGSQQSYSYSQQGDESEQVQQKLNNLQRQQEKIKQQLKQLPYGMILKQRQQLEQQRENINSKKRLSSNKKRHMSKNQPDDDDNKHGPKEMPIHRRPPKKIPQIFESSRQKSIDPRFEQYAGFYNSDLAMKSFDFIPKIQQQQINEIKKTLQASKSVKKNNRNKKRLSQEDKITLQQQYNRLTNERRQQQLLSIQQQAKRNVRANATDGFVPRYRMKEEFEKIKQGRMTDEDRKEYMKKKERKIFKNQQVDRNNLLFETSRRNKERRQGGR